VEVTGAAGADPLLIDSSRLGVLYQGLLKFAADPYSGFRENLVTLRLEINVLMHVRLATAAHRIAAV
jgi:hypothetical protein